MYEFWENLKIKIYNFLNPAQPFVPAGTTPIVEPRTKSNFSFDSLKPSSLKELDFATKRLIVLGATFVGALIILGVLKSDYASYSAARAAAPTTTSAHTDTTPQSTTPAPSTRTAETLPTPPIDD